jgi:hypothetical protein
MRVDTIAPALSGWGTDAVYQPTGNLSIPFVVSEPSTVTASINGRPTSVGSNSITTVITSSDTQGTANIQITAVDAA